MTTFKELGLEASLLQAVDELGFTTPTEIQLKAIPILLSKTQDFIGLAQTGTGKTAAFGLPLLQIIEKFKYLPQALVVCPTRELCVQIVKEISGYKKHVPGVNVVAVYGGTSISLQIKDIRKGVQIIVATPGRLIDLIERKALNLEEIKYVVLDEADEMLNMGFKDDIELILKNTPRKESTWLFSATMPAEIKRVSKQYMDNPQEITVGKTNTGNKNIDHQYYITQSQHRYETLKRLIDFNPGIYGIIFTRTKSDAQLITEKLTREGYDIDALHGDLTQGQRDKVMSSFRNKSLQLLIATDVAARGIDVTGITHVINYELPDDIEVYTHRSGRTGRAGKTGICLSIIHQRETFKLRSIEKIVQAQFHRLDIPNGKDVCRKQFFHFMETLISADVSDASYETYLPQLQEKFAHMSKEDILQRMVSLEFNRFLKYYENAEDLNIKANERSFSPREGDSSRSKFGERKEGRFGERGDRFNRNDREQKSSRFSSNNAERGERRGDRVEYERKPFDDANQTKLFVNLGTKDGFYKASFLQYILDMSDIKKESLGKVDMKEMSSWVEIDKKEASKMIKAIDGQNFKGRKIRMNDANSR